MTTLRLNLPVLLGVLLLAGCTGSGVSETGPAEATRIEIEDFAYLPDRLTVPVGTEISWINRDDFAHTVTSGTPDAPTGGFDLALGEPGEHAASGKMASTVLDEPGQIDYFCRFHPRMTATVIVEEG